MNLIKNLLIGLLSIVSFSAFSQTESGSELNYGVRLGAVVSEFNGATPHTSQKLGFTAGVFVSYSLSDNLSLLAEPGYLQQGGGYTRYSDDSRFGDGSTGPSPVYTTSYKVTMHNIDLPILAKYAINPIGDVTPHIVLGPSVSYNFLSTASFQRTYYYNQTFSTVGGNETITSEFEKIQIGATAGIGASVSLGGKRLLLDLRYKYGITPAKKSFSYIDTFTVQEDIYTNSYYFTLGLEL